MMITHVRSHTHEQKEPAAIWTITHGLYCNPSVHVHVMHEDALTGILPQNISFPDSNTVVIEFSGPRTGEARLV